MILKNIFKLHYLPILTSVWFTLTFIVTFFMSVSSGHVYPYFPFISDTGSVPPESCIFGQMLNIGALFMAAVVYIRYRQVKFAINAEDIVLHKRWNTVALFSGYIACLGISVVANFQETALLLVHLTGAVMTFGNGAFFLLLQTRITYAFKCTYEKHPEHGIGAKIFYLRILLTICFSILYAVVVICTLIAILQFTGTTIIWWTELHGGYDVHLAASIAEWILVACLFVYLISFTNEFKSLEYEEVRFRSTPKSKAVDISVL